ncbi:MAG: BrnA antitoxin family protein [Omnitrophica bacterium]|nr:BrnA antitoxin family protein [Candidatus Omnitrophota bacterium]
MKKHRIDRNMPIGELAKINDFLPSPDKLVAPEQSLKVTLRLNESSINFFKQQAKKYHTKYQKMIRLLLDKYVEKYST